MCNISLIIPIYNTPKSKLIRCLESVMSLQNLSFEVLLINDGSDSYIEEVCLKFVSRFKNFKYMYKPNGGVSSARNLGLKKARGSYIMFVDSDDILHAEKIDKKILKNNPDTIIYDNIVNTQIKKTFCGNEDYVEHDEAMELALTSNKLNTVWGKLFKRKYILENNIIFNRNLVSGEDFYFMLDVLSNKPIIYYIPETVYEYDYNVETSIIRTSKYGLKMLDNIVLNYMLKKKYITILNKEVEKRVALQSINDLINTYFSYICNLLLLKFSTDEIALKINELTQLVEGNQSTFALLSNKSKIKYVLIKKRNWRKLKFLALIRKLHLNLT
ncbi:glycosyltransferase family 2 protein [Atopococcus tabaci]|uniref:glycosyltransferase family 2 protein n=1 Tax=Atopococcus tabaci TaxID=269774 RepID=UPI00041DFEEC|nr:glycosyltransferase family A protein [Atopococcus tabaci]